MHGWPSVHWPMDPSARNLRKWIRDLGDLGAQTLQFAGALGGRRETSSGLLVVGTPEFEPWHFVAHMSEEAERQGRGDLRPTLMRWEVPVGAPAHLARSVDEITHATRDQTVLVLPSGTGRGSCSSGCPTPSDAGRASCRSTVATTIWPTSRTRCCRLTRCGPTAISR